MNITRKTKAEYQVLINKYLEQKDEITKREFCRQENISSSAFYRHFDKYLRLNKSFGALESKPKVDKAKFVEIKSLKDSSKQELKDNLCRYLIIKILGIKIFSLELKYV